MSDEQFVRRPYKKKKARNFDINAEKRNKESKEKTLTSMIDSITGHLFYSTTFEYKSNFYKQLTPRLKWKLIRACHGDLLYKFQDFFNKTEIGMVFPD